MRPRIVHTLDAWSGTELLGWLVPDPAFVYALAMAVVVVVFVRRSHVDHLDRVHALGAAIWGMIGGLLGARIFFLLQHLHLVATSPSIVLDLNGGTVSWGASLGGTVAFILYLHAKRQAVIRFLDVLASCLGLGPFIGRWACFLNGDDYGTLSDLPWAVAFPHGSFPFAAQAQAALIDPLAPVSLPVHPVQLYLSLKGLVLFVVCTALWKRYALPHGLLFCIYWGLFAVARFMLEFLRGDVSRGFVGGLSVGQAMSLAILIVSGAAMILLVARRPVPVFTPKPLAKQS
ncbi:MAG: hypothetical protein C4326_05685 [Ignavibacteria bacterium]